MALGDFVTAAGVEAKDHRVLAQEDPQPPPMPRLAFQVDEDHPAGLVGLGEGGSGVACQQSVVERLKQRFEAFQAAGHGARRQVQIQQPPLVKQPLRGRWLKNLSIRISTHTETPSNPLGISLGGGGAVKVRGQFSQVQVR